MQVFFREFVFLDRSKINAWVALRNTVGVAIALGICLAFGKPVDGLVAGLGALVVSYSDSDDAYLHRARRLLASSLLCSIAVFSGILAIKSVLLATFMAIAWAFLAGLIVVLGPMITDLCIFSLVMFIIFATQPLPLDRAVTFGLLTLGGGLLQTGLSVMFWPIRKYEPERRELGKLYFELGRLISVPLSSKTTPLGSVQITRAHHALSALSWNRALEGDRYRSLLSQAERIRINLVFLLRRKRRAIRNQEENSFLKTLSLFIKTAAESLGLIAQILLTAESAPRAYKALQRLEALIAEARAQSASEDGDIRAQDKELLSQMSSLSGQLRAATDLASRVIPAGTAAFAQREAIRPWRLPFQGSLATLRANLTLNSAACRHGIRMAVAIGLGEIITYAFNLYRSYWIPMTIVLLLKPEYMSTLSRGLLRVLGTLAGLVFATALFRYFPNQTGIEIAFVAGFMFLLRWIGAAHYGVFTFMLSGLVVSLLALSGLDPNDVIYARGLNTCIGGAIALITYWAWPTWSRTQVQETMAQMLDSYRVYFHEVAAEYLNPDPNRSLDQSRLASRVARSNQEASAAHTEAEPGTPETHKRLLRAMQASSNRFAYNIMALEAGDKNGFAPEDLKIFAVFSEKVEQTLILLAEALRTCRIDPQKFPDLRAIQAQLIKINTPGNAISTAYAETDRLTNSLNTLREQVLLWVNTVSGHTISTQKVERQAELV
ncbi:MAG: FUSC family protein [Oligoflexia bacterium]|nr:FUSC family protein [Oligoflexia bacterium]